MKNKAMVAFGLLLVVAAVIAVVVAGPMQAQGEHIGLYQDSARGDSMVNAAGTIKAIGIGAGVVGAILLLAGLLRKSARQQLPPTDRV